MYRVAYFHDFSSHYFAGLPLLFVKLHPSRFHPLSVRQMVVMGLSEAIWIRFEQDVVREIRGGTHREHGR